MKARLFQPVEIRAADVVIVGDGLAGLMAALHAGDREVLLVGKTAAAAGGSSIHAQGGVAAAVGPDDAPRLHGEDTLRAGAGLCDPDVVRRVTAEGPRRLAELVAWGANFDRSRGGGLALGREGAHSRNRIVHAAGDATGRELMRALTDAVLRTPTVARADNVLALALVSFAGAVVGVAAVDRAGRHTLFAAPDVVLATGGIGRLWHRSTNPRESTGDGLAMALRAGAVAADLEFVQFHPTALAVDEPRLPLLTEALRGAGAVLVDASGRRFMPAEHPEADLAPRDVVARAIWRRLREGSEIFLDARCLGEGVWEKFPTVTALCGEHGLDPSRDLLPVTPAAHYHMGGVVVDADGRTSVPGLWACGEVARTGLHGANRLASNSLLEAAVYGAAVGRAITRNDRRPMHPVRLRDAVSRAGLLIAENPWRDEADEADREAEARLRLAMWEGVGLERHAGGLRKALDDISALRSTLGAARSEVSNMAHVASIVARAALRRTESRGAHFRGDFPHTFSCWQQPLYFDGDRALNPKSRVSATVAG